MIYILKIKKPQTTTGKVLLVVSIITIAILGSEAVMDILWGQELMTAPNSPVDPPYIFLGKQEDDNYWNLTVGEIVWPPPQISLPKDCVRLSNIYYVAFPHNNSISLDYGLLSNITDKPSGYNITFLDNDHDNMVSVNDTIRISKNGGSKGTIKTGDRIELICSMTGISEVYLNADPPHIFFNKQEDDNYWNLTVYLVDWSPYNSLPKDCVQLSKISYLATRKGMRVELSLLSYADESAYNITFLDNDHDNMVSVNDTIRISKNGGPSGTIKTGDRIILIYLPNRCMGDVYL